MPLLQAMTERANHTFSRKNIAAVSWPAGAKLPEVAEKLGIAETEKEVAFLEKWPSSIQAAITAVFEDAVSHDPPIPVQIVWIPDYDYAMSVWDAHAVKGSTRAITMEIRSPYPED